MFFTFLKRLIFWRKLDTASQKYFETELQKLQHFSELEQIIRCDTLYHKILQKLGYRGSFWEILKRNPKEIPNIQEIWRLHKLRNTLVHELGASQQNLSKQGRDYKESIMILLQKVGKTK